MAKVDRRREGGLNNQKFPLRPVVETIRREDLKTYYEVAPVEHRLACGHTLPAVGPNYVRHRRCYRCGVPQNVSAVAPLH